MFQEIVDTYGVPSYKEINPAVYTQVTFPFLFGVMFGDIGHGLMLFVPSTILLLWGAKLSQSYPSLKPFYRARYLLALMGFFSTFCGLVYNDFFSVPLNLFGSCYDFTTAERTPDCVYSCGVDPIWYLSV